MRTVGRWLPMTVFGVATVICATLRMLAIAMHIIWLHARRKERYSMIVVDQVRTCGGQGWLATALQCADHRRRLADLRQRTTSTHIFREGCELAHDRYVTAARICAASCVLAYTQR